MDETSTPVRIDKWLWAARFFKTRTLANDAVRGGRVHLNDQAAKPSKDVRPGDRLQITLGQQRVTVLVRATSERRGSATLAAQLYEETPESRVARERHAAQARMARPVSPAHGGRPTKRDRRRYESDARARRGER